MTQISARLVPLTEEARTAIDNSEHIEIKNFPFSIGREQRSRLFGRDNYPVERRKLDESSRNDYFLIETCIPMHISRKHLELEHIEGALFRLTDRHSACGTVVDERMIGGSDRGGQIKIKTGQTIRIGSKLSPYLFRFEADIKLDSMD